jgi:flagellar biogenesis protein FliO
MNCWFGKFLVASAVCVATTQLAATAQELPDWQDEGSVYLSIAQSKAADETKSPSAVDLPVHETSATPAIPAATIPRDKAVVHAVHRDGSTSDLNRNRHLTPLGVEPTPPVSNSAKTRSAAAPFSQFALPAGTIYSTSAALAVVVGLFLLCMWLLRRGTRRSATALPAEVVSVVGRVPLAARQYAELLRVGNKLVLVSLTATGAEPLTEVTDPVEVNRLLGLCQQFDPHSTTKAFEDVFRQLSREPAPAGLFAPDTSFSSAPPEAPYRAQRREARNV